MYYNALLEKLFPNELCITMHIFPFLLQFCSFNLPNSALCARKLTSMDCIPPHLCPMASQWVWLKQRISWRLEIRSEGSTNMYDLNSLHQVTGNWALSLYWKPHLCLVALTDLSLVTASSPGPLRPRGNKAPALASPGNFRIPRQFSQFNC